MSKNINPAIISLVRFVAVIAVLYMATIVYGAILNLLN